MDIEARKQQEPVSENSIKHDKGEWNDTVQLLVAKLLAFKRGLNGVGDDRAHLPPVDMSDPFPTEMSIYLNSIVDDYVAVVDGAKDIINDQEEYSKADELPPELLAQASWWGSRTWARLGLLGLGKQRKIRLNMIGFANESLHDLYNIENDLTSNDANGIARAVRRMLKLMNGFDNVFVPEYNELMAEMTLPQEEKKTEEVSNQQVQPLEPTEPEMSEEIYSEKAPDYSETHKKYHHDIDQREKKPMPWLERNVKKIRAAKAPTQSEKTSAEIAFSEVRSAHTTVKAFSFVSEEPISHEAAASLRAWSDSINAAVELFKSIKNKYYETWHKMEMDSSDLDRESAEKYFDKQNAEIIKLTHTTLTRWINRKLMGLSSKKLNRMKLTVVNNLLEVKKAFDKFMDVLEDRGSKGSEISASFQYLSILLSTTSNNLWPVGKHYMLSQDMRPREKDKPVLRLSDRQLKELKMMSNKLAPSKEVKQKLQYPDKKTIAELTAKVGPIFNSISLKMHPGGIDYKVKPLVDRETGEVSIGIIVSPNIYVKRQRAAEGEIRVVTEWKKVKEYLKTKFKDKMVEKYEPKLGYPITIHILE